MTTQSDPNVQSTVLSLVRWQLLMVTQNMLRKHEGKLVLSDL